MVYYFHSLNLPLPSVFHLVVVFNSLHCKVYLHGVYNWREHLWLFCCYHSLRESASSNILTSLGWLNLAWITGRYKDYWWNHVFSWLWVWVTATCMVYDSNGQISIIAWGGWSHCWCNKFFQFWCGQEDTWGGFLWWSMSHLIKAILEILSVTNERVK